MSITVAIPEHANSSEMLWIETKKWITQNVSLTFNIANLQSGMQPLTKILSFVCWFGLGGGTVFLLLLLFWLGGLVFVWDGVSGPPPDCPGTHYRQVGFELPTLRSSAEVTGTAHRVQLWRPPLTNTLASTAQEWREFAVGSLEDNSQHWQADRRHLTIHCAVSRDFLMYVSSVLSWREEGNGFSLWILYLSWLSFTVSSAEPRVTREWALHRRLASVRLWETV